MRYEQSRRLILERGGGRGVFFLGTNSAGVSLDEDEDADGRNARLRDGVVRRVDDVHRGRKGRAAKNSVLTSGVKQLKC